MQIIQIRGGNATGKTTTVRQFCEKNDLKIQEINVNGIITYITTNNKDIVVLGRYDKLNGGCDLFKNRNHVMQTLLYVIKNIRPKLIVFEGILYGITYKMSYDVNLLAQMYGYKYLGITLYRSKENGMEILKKRNGNSNVNEEHFLQKYKSSFVSHSKLAKMGVNVKFVNTDNIKRETMWQIIENNREK